tara:strand:+ start:195 stop:821 length:627 start_codon:yes stop_codon:yes gene_type:complete
VSTSKGFFISFEGIDGCGKSTQIKMLCSYLRDRNIEFLIVREPGGTDISEQIRKILLHNHDHEISDRTEALLMTGSRAQLIDEKILPFLNQGKIVIADRFLDSTLAYQGGGRKLDINWLIDLNNFATNNTFPDITFFIDIEPEVGAKRSGSSKDRIESVGLEFQSRVRQSYIKLSTLFKDRYITLDGNQEKKIIHKKIVSHLLEKDLR